MKTDGSLHIRHRQKKNQTKPNKNETRPFDDGGRPNDLHNGPSTVLRSASLQ